MSGVQGKIKRSPEVQEKNAEKNAEVQECKSTGETKKKTNECKRKRERNRSARET